jgi:hypothetical protein
LAFLKFKFRQVIGMFGALFLFQQSFNRQQLHAVKFLAVRERRRRGIFVDAKKNLISSVGAASPGNKGTSEDVAPTGL